MTTSQDLINYAKKSLKGKKFVVAIQRESYVHTDTPEGVRLERLAGGAHILLDGILRKVGGLMVAIASGSADAKTVDSHQRVKVPPAEESYTLKRIFLKKKELGGFYYGFANQILWPLSHAVFIKPIFNYQWWDEYVKVNKKFADAILEELNGEDAFIWINDYHLSLLPLMLKEKQPSLTIGTFWHIPWPAYEIFRICPWRKQILQGLLGSDFIGFHRGYHVENFIDCARRELEVIVDYEPRAIIHKDRQTKVSHVPAGIDYHEIQENLDKIKHIGPQLIKKDFGFDYEYLAIGVDRIDYTKGLPERLQIIDKFLEKHPEFQGKFVYLSIGAPSRLHIPAYKQLNREIFDLVEKINWKYMTPDWKPIYFIDKVLPRERIFAYYRLADACFVTSLDDGMNLVAKEFVLCNDMKKGILLLSKFTGAAKDLKQAFLINPYDIDGSADALYHALTLPAEQKLARNKEMRAVVKENNIYDWGIQFIKNTLERTSER